MRPTRSGTTKLDLMKTHASLEGRCPIWCLDGWVKPSSEEAPKFSNRYGFALAGVQLRNQLKNAKLDDFQYCRNALHTSPTQIALLRRFGQ